VVLVLVEKVDVEQLIMDLEDKMLFRIQDLVEEDLQDLQDLEMVDVDRMVL
jgi:hypothetical protein